MKRILVVDDSPAERQNIVDILTSVGHITFTASNGTEAIEMAKSLKPDLIVMDVVMPGINGFQATREIGDCPETSTIPVVICTTKGQGSDKKWGVMQGAKGYVVKPFSSDELIAAINEVQK